MKTQEEIDARARAANSKDLWDSLWSSADTADWRREALSQVYMRIERTFPKTSQYLIDVGGGQGDLAFQLQGSLGVRSAVWDHSPVALQNAVARGVWAVDHVDIEDVGAVAALFANMGDRSGMENRVSFVCTELLEHLSKAARSNLLRLIHTVSESAFFSVPNARLSPEEEHQHTIEFTAVTLLDELREVWGDEVRVAAMGPYLLGTCGTVARKGFKLSMCLPVRDEEADLEKVLASFREVADEIVVGIDPRSKDKSEEIARRYAEVVFELYDPNLALHYQFLDDPALPDYGTGPDGARWGVRDDDPRLPEKGVHFAWVRNQCMRRCTGDYIFMTEGHERLGSGHDHLLNLDRIVTPNGGSPDVFVVARQLGRQQWGFPWLTKNDPDRLFYVRGTHNTLEYPPEAIAVKVSQIMTIHERAHTNAMARAEQRQVQNRDSLQDDWERSGNTNSLFYLGQEIRADDPKRGAEMLELYLEQEDGNGLARYQARLMLAKIYGQKARKLRTEALEVVLSDPDAGESLAAEAATTTERCRVVLMGATEDDWSRSEHWVWLGDLAFAADQLEQALMFYRYAGTLVGEPPFGPWWVDLDLYGYLPAQRLAMCYTHLGRGEEGLAWAKKVYETLPEESPAWALEEARTNIRQLEDAMSELAGIETEVV